MMIGTQLVSPDGYKGFSSGVVYHLLSNNQFDNAARFVVFFEGNNGVVPRILSLPRVDFEEALLSGAIIAAEHQSDLPPWLSELSGRDLSNIDLYRRKPKKPHKDLVEERYLVISYLVENEKEIVFSKDPDLIINRHARSYKPRQNETRVRLWFYTYILYGKNIWSLLPPFHRIGGWDRLEKSENSKFGRPSLSAGRNAGFGVDNEMREKILDGYAKHVAEGKTIAELYSTVMAKIFGCTVNSGRNGVKQYFHPDGKPFPSFYQFSYWVRRGFVANELYKSRYGEARVREKLAANRGTFIESVSNIMERVELDGYYCPDRPVGVIEGSVLPALCVVRVTCVCSGMLVGIGFALGSERLSAYKMALFSMAVGKAEFCKLFGIVIDEDAWPSVGMSPEIVMDRGPGATLNLDGLEKYITVRDLAPSYSGQSKAVVESSHPRDITLNGEPSYLKSNLTVVEMAKREIFRILAENDSSDASSRMTPEMWNSGVYPFPNSIWSFMDSRARTSAYSMSLDKAVRLFLTEIEVTIERDGTYFNTRKFDSVEFRAAGIYEKASISRGRIKCKGYLMEMCVRHIWVEFGERLYKLDALLPIRDDVGQLYISIADLDLEVANRRKTESEFRRHKIAASGHQKQEFESNTGKSWGDADRKSGRVKKGLASQREYEDTRRGFSGGKRSS